MTSISWFFAIIFVSYTVNTTAKIYTRCKLIKELQEKYGLSPEIASKYACIAEATGFNTSNIVHHYRKPKESDSLGYKPHYGIFYIGSDWWCNEREKGGICDIKCDDLLDDDLNNDIECVQKIDLDMNDTAWVLNSHWSRILKHDCEKQIENCANGVSAEDENSWTRVGDCLNNFPQFNNILGATSCHTVHAGDSVSKYEFPHISAVGWIRENSNKIDWNCSGTLISEDFILTAAHCTNTNNLEPDVVRLGDLNLKTNDDDIDAQQYTIERIYKHDEYTTRYNDIALLKLSKPVDITNYVTPACLFSSDEIMQNEVLEIAGWGSKFFSDTNNTFELTKGRLSVVTNEECAQDHVPDRTLNRGLLDTHLCAIDKSEKRQEPCAGDSGGPLELKLQYENRIIPFVAGITAFGRGCGGFSPSVFTRVSKYLEWIVEHVKIPVDPIECSLTYQKNRYKVKPVDDNHPIKLVLGSQDDKTASAIIITDQFLIASAYQLSKISNPNRVHVTTNSTVHEIEKIYYHPEYKSFPSIENDIALIKLKTRIRWFRYDYPSCLADDFLIPDSFDRTVIQETYSSYGSRHRETFETNVEDCYNQYNITPFNRSSSNLCFKTNVYYIPNSCEVPTGAPIIKSQQIVEDSCSTRKTITYGLTVFNEDCGLVLATKVSDYIPWIDSIIYGSNT